MSAIMKSLTKAYDTSTAADSRSLSTANLEFTLRAGSPRAFDATEPPLICKSFGGKPSSLTPNNPTVALIRRRLPYPVARTSCLIRPPPPQVVRLILGLRPLASPCRPFPSTRSSLHPQVRLQCVAVRILIQRLRAISLPDYLAFNGERRLQGRNYLHVPRHRRLYLNNGRATKHHPSNTGCPPGVLFSQLGQHILHVGSIDCHFYYSRPRSMIMSILLLTT